MSYSFDDEELEAALSERIGIAHSEMGDTLKVLISIGQGIGWSKEFEQRARALAEEVDDEFSLIGTAVKDGLGVELSFEED